MEIFAIFLLVIGGVIACGVDKDNIPFKKFFYKDEEDD